MQKVTFCSMKAHPAMQVKPETDVKGTDDCHLFSCFMEKQ